MRHALLLPSLLLLATPALSAEIACEGPFAADSSEQRLKEAFGAENVVTGDSPGPEGTTVLATTVYPDDPERMMVFGWWDEENLSELSYVKLAPGDSAFGVSRGMGVDAVEALNGEVFTMTGLWWDYGGYAGFQSGALAELPGDCSLSLRFDTALNVPDGIDVGPISGDQQVSSDEPLLDQLSVEVTQVTLGYAYPGLDEMDGIEMPEDQAGG